MSLRSIVVFLYASLIVTLFGCRNNTVVIPKLEGYKKVRVLEFGLHGPVTTVNNQYSINNNIVSAREAFELAQNNKIKFTRFPVQFNKTDLKETFNIEITDSAAYAAFVNLTVASEVEQEVCLLVAGEKVDAVYLNGSIVRLTPRADSYHPYQHLLKVKLLKGRNNVFLINRHDDELWHFNIEIASLGYGFERFKEYYSNNYLSSSLLSGIDTLSIYHSIFDGFEIKSILYNAKHELVSDKIYVDSVSFPLQGHKDGIYHSRIIVNGTQFDQSFIVGNPKNIFSDLVNESLTDLSSQTKNEINLNALVQRLNHLLKYKPYTGQSYYKYRLFASEDLIDWKLVYNDSSNTTTLSRSIPIYEKGKYIKLECLGNSFNPFTSIREVAFYQKDSNNNAVSCLIDTAWASILDFGMETKGASIMI
ncbi:MAG: hypothetical protein HC896_07235 [Bacteroidales bacterium]|nr:hypothetical protein [Bacteroidales bacterium]